MNWGVIVTVDSVDLSATLVDSAPVTIEAERSAARIAEFTVYLIGSVDPNAWVGRQVTIDVTVGTTQTRLFTGVIAEPELDIATMTLRCRCTDDVQRIVDGMTQTALLTLTGAYWSDDVFDVEASGWERLQDMLTTVPKAVWLTTTGTLVCDSQFNKSTPDITVTEDHIIDDSLRVTLAQRENLINRVDVTLNARFERLYHRVETLTWSWPLSFCETFEYGIKHMIKQVVRDAVKNAGWHLISESYTPLWATGIYNCGSGPVAFNNLSPDQLINGFTIDAAKRWAQSVTDAFTITVKAPASIAVYGELKQSLSASVDFKSSDADTWDDDNANYAVLPAGFAWDDGGNRYRDDIDSIRLAAALNAVIGQAIERINTSHRSSVIEFDLPLTPDIDLSYTVRVDVSQGASTVDAKGIVNRIRHTLEISTARAITAVEVLVSSGRSGLDTPTQTWTPPSHPSQPTGPGNAAINVPNHIGRSWGNQPYDPSMWGWFVNRATPEIIGGAPADPDISYEERLEIALPAIDDAKTQHRTDVVPYTLDIDVPDNLLAITA